LRWADTVIDSATIPTGSSLRPARNACGVYKKAGMYAVVYIPGALQQAENFGLMI
jgi:hypothetical protein